MKTIDKITQFQQDSEARAVTLKREQKANEADLIARINAGGKPNFDEIKLKIGELFSEIVAIESRKETISHEFKILSEFLKTKQN